MRPGQRNPLAEIGNVNMAKSKQPLAGSTGCGMSGKSYGNTGGVRGVGLACKELRELVGNEDLLRDTNYMRELEVARRPAPDYITTMQTSITAHKRAVLVDWLVEVADEFRLATETLYLTISYIDRYLAQQHLEDKDLQLLGVACMCVASKFEDVDPPAVSSFSYITDHSCSQRDIVNAEAHILRRLNYKIADLTAKTFLQRFLIFLRSAHVATTVEYSCLEVLARYILELSLLDVVMLQFRTSTIAAAALLLARALLVCGQHQLAAKAALTSAKWRPHMLWPDAMEVFTLHTAEDLEVCARKLHTTLLYHSSPKRMFAIKRKYQSPKRSSVSNFKFVECLPDKVFERFSVFLVPEELLAHVPM